LATTRENRSTAFGFHTSSKAKLALSSPFRRLISSFHVKSILDR
jgi:hypothetical protein